MKDLQKGVKEGKKKIEGEGGTGTEKPTDIYPPGGDGEEHRPNPEDRHPFMPPQSPQPDTNTPGCP
jgi:hypothetical protein